MSDFLDNLVDRSLGQADVLRPRPQSIFELPGDTVAPPGFSQQYEPADESREPAPLPPTVALGEPGVGLKMFAADIAPSLQWIGGTAMLLADSIHQVARPERPRLSTERVGHVDRPDPADVPERWPAARSQAPGSPRTPRELPASTWPGQRSDAGEPDAWLGTDTERLASAAFPTASAAWQAGKHSTVATPIQPKPARSNEAGDLTLETQVLRSAAHRRSQEEPALDLLMQAGLISWFGRTAARPTVIPVELPALAAVRGAWWIQPPTPVVARTPTTRPLAMPGISEPAVQRKGEPTDSEALRSPRQLAQPGPLRAEAWPATFAQAADTMFKAEPAAAPRARARDGAQDVPMLAWLAGQPDRARLPSAELLAENWAPARVAEAARQTARQSAKSIARAEQWGGDQQADDARLRAFQRPGKSPSSPDRHVAAWQAAPPVDAAAAPATVQVTIGRVEVRAAPAERQSRPQAARALAMSLDEYLRQRGGGRP